MYALSLLPLLELGVLSVGEGVKADIDADCIASVESNGQLKCSDGVVRMPHAAMSWVLDMDVPEAAFWQFWLTFDQDCYSWEPIAQLKHRVARRHSLVSHNTNAEDLQINTLSLSDLSGELGWCSCPGMQLTLRYDTSVQRNLAKDIKTILGWGAVTIVSLMGPDELETLGVSDLSTSMLMSDIHWHYLELADATVPDERFLAHWKEACHDIVGALKLGERVLLHSRLGAGRAPMLVGMLLRELGYSVEEVNEALTVQAERVPGSVLMTWRQEQYLASYAPVTGSLNVSLC